MIWESYYWKQDLLKTIDILKKWSRKKPSTRGEVIFEKKIFYAAYAIRKLIEAGKIEPNWEIPAQKFIKNNSKKEITFLNSHKIFDFYDFDAFNKISISTLNLSNLIIHSFIFCLNFSDEMHVEGFLIASDKSKKEALLSINLDDFLSILHKVCHSSIVKMRCVTDPREKIGYRITSEYQFCPESCHYNNTPKTTP